MSALSAWRCPYRLRITKASMWMGSHVQQSHSIMQVLFDPPIQCFTNKAPALVRPEENDQSAEASAENDDDQHLPRNMTRASLVGCISLDFFSYSNAILTPIQAKERDGGQCILTGAGAGRLEVAHTVPFSINNSVTRCSALERTINSVIHLFPYQNHRYRNLLYKRGPGCTDYPWNMLTLSSTLYSVWAEARFGIFWKHSWIDEHDPSITKAKLQIRLFKQDGKDKDGKKTLDSHRLMNIDDDDEFHRMISVVNGIHGENSQVEGLYSGSIFYIRIPTIDAEKMQAMMDFQWACLCIHNMAGGGRPEDLPILCVYPPMELDEWRKWTRWGGIESWLSFPTRSVHPIDKPLPDIARHC